MTYGSGPDGLIVEKDILEYASQTLESGKVKTTPTAKKWLKYMASTLRSERD